MKFRIFYTMFLLILLSTGFAAAHNWYEDLKAPNGQLCCNNDDCQSVGHRYTPESGHEVEIRGHWTTVSPNVILPISSPDGQTHACFEWRWSLYGSKTTVSFVLRCVILGGEA
jgi:hypothetical protein